MFTMILKITSEQKQTFDVSKLTMIYACTTLQINIRNKSQRQVQILKQLSDLVSQTMAWLMLNRTHLLFKIHQFARPTFFKYLVIITLRMLALQLVLFGVLLLTNEQFKTDYIRLRACHTD